MLHVVCLALAQMPFYTLVYLYVLLLLGLSRSAFPHWAKHCVTNPRRKLELLSIAPSHPPPCSVSHGSTDVFAFFGTKDKFAFLPSAFVLVRLQGSVVFVLSRAVLPSVPTALPHIVYR